MNRSQIRSLVIETTGRDDKTTLINSAINIALAKISAEHLWSDLSTEASVTLTADTNSVTLASDMRRLTEFRVIDGLQSYPLTILKKSRVVSMFPSPTSYASSKPEYGWLEGVTLSMVPPPDSAYPCSYTYYKAHADLTSDTDTLTILQADEAIIAYTTYYVFKSIEKHEDAEKWLADYYNLLRDAKKMDSSPAVQRPAVERKVSRISPGYHLDPFVRTNP